MVEGVALAPISGAPQVPQNRPGGGVAPHAGQMIVSVPPQEGQKRCPGGVSAKQCGHTVTPRPPRLACPPTPVWQQPRPPGPPRKIPAQPATDTSFRATQRPRSHPATIEHHQDPQGRNAAVINNSLSPASDSAGAMPRTRLRAAVRAKMVGAAPARRRRRGVPGRESRAAPRAPASPAGVRSHPAHKPAPAAPWGAQPHIGTDRRSDLRVCGCLSVWSGIR